MTVKHLFQSCFKIWLVINASIWGTCSHIQIHVHQYWFVLVCTFWLMRFSKHIDGMGWLRSVRGTQQRDTISGSNGCRGNVVSWLLLSKSLVFTLWVSSVNHCMGLYSSRTCAFQARRQEFPEGGSTTSIANRAPRGRGSGGRSRPPETLGYLEQNPAI